MDLTIIYIGISQSIFAAILLFFLRTQSIADKILGGWFIAISLLFVLNAIKKDVNISQDLWPISVNISLTFPQFLYLYSKYITKEYDKFIWKDFFHFIPSFIGILIVLIYYSSEITNLSTFAKYYSTLTLPRTIIGYLFIACLWGYTFGTYIHIHRYKKHITNYYSFDSYKINLSWLLIVIISFFLAYHIQIIFSSLHLTSSFSTHVEVFRSGSLLIYVYILTILGLKQQQLVSAYTPIKLNKSTIITESTLDNYKKSGLSDNQAEIYLHQLVAFINQSEIWKDQELSVAKISEQTNIPKHYITQVLNQYLHKNFYTFVNEYRTEYAMKLITSPKYKNWSFLAIAYESGFNSKTAFNNFFKKHTNMTPTEFKKSKTSTITN